MLYFCSVFRRAALAELVDALDLGSSSHEWRFESFMPHTMKKIFIFCLALAALTSCKWKGEAESTPMLFFSHFVLSDSTHTDTLKIQIPSSSLCILDTISPLDTVDFVIGADAVYNILIHCPYHGITIKWRLPLPLRRSGSLRKERIYPTDVLNFNLFIKAFLCRWCISRLVPERIRLRFSCVPQLLHTDLLNRRLFSLFANIITVYV